MTKSDPVPSPPTLTRKTAQLALNWMDENQTPSPEFKRTLFALGEQSPLTSMATIVLSHGVPDEVNLSISSNDFRERIITRIDVTGRLTLEGGMRSELIVQNLEAIENQVTKNSNLPPVWTMKVSGLGKLLSSSEEGAVYLSLKLMTEGDLAPLETIEIPLFTPPSKIAGEQFTLAEFEGKNGPIPEVFKTYISLGQRLDLIQVVRIKNSSPHPVAIGLPLKLNGVLTTHYQKIELLQARCAFTTHHIEWDDALSSDIYLMPLNNETAHGYLNFINASISTNGFEVPMLSGEEKLIGIYAQGEKTLEFVLHGKTAQAYSSVPAINGCRTYVIGI